MKSESKKDKTSLITLLIIGPLIVLPFMLLFDRNEVFWNEKVTSIPYQIYSKPEIFSLHKGGYEIRFNELNKNKYYVINYGSYALLKESDVNFKIISNLKKGDSLNIIIPKNNLNDNRIRIVGLKYKNMIPFTPLQVNKYEKKDFYSRTIGFLIVLLLGLLIKLISYIKSKRRTVF